MAQITIKIAAWMKKIFSLKDQLTNTSINGSFIDLITTINCTCSS